MKNSLSLIFIFSLWIVGCDQNSTNTTTTADTEAELLQLIQNDDALQLDGLADNDISSLDYSSGLEDGGLARIVADTLWPNSDEYRLRFGRHIDDITSDVTYDISNDSIAYASVVWTVTGTFRVIALDSNLAVMDSIVKSFETTFHRHIRFRYWTPPNSDSIRFHDGLGPHWRVDGMTIGDGISGNKVALQAVRVYGQYTDSLVHAYTAEDVDSIYYQRDDMPIFHMARGLHIEVDVTNQGPEFPLNSGEFVFYHFGQDRWHKVRKVLVDEDSTGVYDNTFEANWRVPGPGVGHNRALFHGFFEVVDMGSLFTRDEAFHNEIWTLPFMAHRRGH